MLLATAPRRWNYLGAIAVALAAALVGLGVASRLAVYRSDPILSLDEAMLALNVARRGWMGLTHPLMFQQTAPVLFLWWARLAILVGGVTAYALRAAPLIAGLASIPLVWYAARALVSPGAALLAAALAALYPLGIEYGAIVKPYAVDAAVTAGILALGLGTVQDGRTWRLAAIILTPLLSAPSIFVAFPCLLAVLIAVPAARRHTGIVVATWGAVACLNFLFFQRVVVGSAYLQHFWGDAFLRPPAGTMFRLVRLRAGYLMEDLFTGYAVNYSPVYRWLLLCLPALGLVHVGRRHGWWATLMLGGPIAAVGVAAAGAMYPLADRTLLFLAPLIIVAAVAGLDAITTHVPAVWRPTIFALAGLLLIIPDAIDATVHGFPRRDRRVQSSLTAVWRRVQAGDPVYVYPLDVPRWVFYTTDWTQPDTSRVDSLTAMATVLGPNSGNRPPRGYPVVDEGCHLVLRAGQHTELIGVPTGIEILSDGPIRRTPDPGWASNEAARVRAAAAPGIWLVFIHGRSVAAALGDTLIAGGGQVTEGVRVPNGLIAYRFERRGS
jgi:Dolichyl-phosphate-mannose-protein mannosyltransferase